MAGRTYDVTEFKARRMVTCRDLSGMTRSRFSAVGVGVRGSIYSRWRPSLLSFDGVCLLRFIQLRPVLPNTFFSMAQLTDIEKGPESQAAPGFLTSTVLALVISLTCKLDDRNEQPPDQSLPPSPPATPPQELDFGDPSGPLFSLYSDIADKEDKEFANRWQQDAKDILVFVSSHVAILTAT
jgi:hypothetical protein